MEQLRPFLHAASDGGYSASSGEGLIGGAAPLPPDRRSGGERRVNTAPYHGPERRKAVTAQRSEPDYGHHQSSGTQKLSGKTAQIESGNVYGLASRSELNYPTAYAPVSRELWAEMSEEQRAAIMRTQAIAQEKVGYEKHTTKYFIEDIGPADPAAAGRAAGKSVGRVSTSVSQQAGAASGSTGGLPYQLIGGVLIGAGGLGLALALSGNLPLLPGAPAAGAAVLIGAVLAVISWR